ncbi:MAG: ribonuclease HI family protein [Deltaproteobacteria bacterium]
MKPKQDSLPFKKAQKKGVEIFIDGAARGNPGESGIGVFIIDENGGTREIKKYLGTRTNNQAEYTALITALQSAKEHSKKSIQIYTDSLLLANQINGVWKVKNPEIAVLNKEAKKLLKAYRETSISHIPRERNKEADRLANLAIDEYL